MFHRMSQCYVFFPKEGCTTASGGQLDNKWGNHYVSMYHLFKKYSNS